MERTFTTVHSKKISLYLLFALVALVSATSSFGQTSIGDYRSKASGNWSDASTWQVKTASTDGWQDAVAAPTTTSNVYVQDAHTITLTATADCKDFNSNTNSVTTIGTNTLNVYGKIRAYTGTAETSSADGTTVGTSTTVLVAAMITTSTGGLLKFVGNSRTITAAGEWNSTSLANDAEFALTAGQTGSLTTGIKFRNVTISSGIVSTTTFISIGTTAALTIKNGARLISSRSGASSTFVAFSSTVKCGTVEIENGAVLELTGTTPSIDCTTFTNNGTVVYSRSGSQTLLQRGPDVTSTTALNSYDTLVLSGTSTKTPFASITVSTLLQFTGTATLGATSALSLTMLNGSTVDRGATSGTSLPSATGAVLYGTSATDLVNVTISSNINNSNEIPSVPTPGKVGTLTIASGFTYTFISSRTVTNLVNNGFVAFSPGTSLTFTIEGGISGTGTITGHANAAVAFTGTNSGNAGTLNFTSGSQVAGGLTINRTGTNASVTLGTPVTLFKVNATGTLSLTAGTLIGNDNLITVNGNINGSSAGIYTATANGKILMTGNTIASTIASVTLANLELNDADGFTLSSPKITGVLTVSLGTATISGTLTLKSDATGTASIANSAGTITGNVTVERYIPSSARRRYVLVGSPVTSTINAGWQEGGAANAGYGTLITGGAAGGTNGFDLPTSSAKSIFTYNDDNTPGSKWVGLGNTDATNLAPGAGYLLFVRGDRTLDIAINPTGSGNTTLRATGTVGQGSVSPTLLSGASKYTLIANPYPCAIDWNSGSLTKTNLTSSFTVYDANNSVFVSSNGTVKTPSIGNQQAGYIQSGQAFFVQNTEAGNGAITFTEAAKTTAAATSSSTTVFGEDANKAQLNINVYRTADNSFADGVVVLFGNNYKTAIDSKEDIYKFTNLSETFGLRRNNTVLGLEARPKVQSTDTTYFSLKSFAKKSYKLVLDGNNFEQTTSAKLEDKFTGTSTVIDVNGTTTYNFTVSDDAASSSNDRFIITFGSTAASTVIIDGTAATSLYVKMSPNPVRNQLQVSFKTATAEATNINVVNSLGQVVKTVNAGNVSIGNVSVPVSELATGVYTVQLVSGGKVVSTQQVVKAEN